MILNGLPNDKNDSLSPILSLPAQPVAPDLVQVAQALNAAAAALAAAARALSPALSVSIPDFSLAFPQGLPPASSLELEVTSVIEGINLFLRTKARAGRSDRYLRQLRVSLKSFAFGRAHSPVAGVTVADLEKWLDKNHWSAKTVQNYIKDVSTLFNFLKRRGLVTANPAMAVELPKANSAPQSLHTPEQVKIVLEFARKHDLNVLRVLAVRYFAGLRSAEAERLSEREILPNHLEVTAAKSKTRSRRLVEIEPNLRTWLALGGSLPLHNVNNTMRRFTAALRKETSITWPHNVTRHSFISYHLARGGSASRTALAAGTSEQLVFSNYRELATAESAASFFALVPK